MIVLSKNNHQQHNNPVKILRIIRNGSMNLLIIGDDYVYTPKFKNLGNFIVIIQNATLEDGRINIDRYIASVSDTPQLLDDTIKIYHFDAKILESDDSVTIRIEASSLGIGRQNVRVPVYRGQTVEGILVSLSRMVGISEEDLLSFTELVDGLVHMSLDSVYDGQTFFTLID